MNDSLDYWTIELDGVYVARFDTYEEAEVAFWIFDKAMREGCALTIWRHNDERRLHLVKMMSFG